MGIISSTQMPDPPPQVTRLALTASDIRTILDVLNQRPTTGDTQQRGARRTPKAPKTLNSKDVEHIPMVSLTREMLRSGRDCATCLQAFKRGERVVKLDCSHIFHHQCIVPWLTRNATCPLCRRRVDPRKWTGRVMGGGGVTAGGGGGTTTANGRSSRGHHPARFQ